MARIQTLVDVEPSLGGVVDVRAVARARGARRAVVDGARRHQRDPARRDREGAAMTVDPLLLDTAERAFADTCTHEAIQAAERDGWAPSIWDTAAGIGLPWIGVPEAAGGAGGTVADGVAVLGVAGTARRADPARRDRAARRVAARRRGLAGRERARHGRSRPSRGRPPPRRRPTVRAPRTGCRGRVRPSGSSRWSTARSWRSRRAPRASSPISNLAGEPRDTVVFEDVRRRRESPTHRTASMPTRCCSVARSTRAASDGRSAARDVRTDRRVHERTPPVRSSGRAVPGGAGPPRALRRGGRARRPRGAGRRARSRSRRRALRDRRRRSCSPTTPRASRRVPRTRRTARSA